MAPANTPTTIFTPELCAAIVASYQEGAGLSVLARRYRCGVARLYAVLAEAGVPLRPRGRPRVERPTRTVRHPDNPGRDPKVKTIDAAELIAAGEVTPGAAEWHYKGSVVQGELQTDGSVLLPGRSEPFTLGGASHLLNGRWDSGYLVWHVRDREGALHPLDTIRRRYLARREQG